MRVRGLKPNKATQLRQLVKSHPMRVRGLKHRQPTEIEIQNGVAPHAGAWIETMQNSYLPFVNRRSHPMRVRGLKQTSGATLPVKFKRRTPCGCVD